MVEVLVFFFPSETVFQKAQHLMDLNRRLVRVDARFKRERAAVF